MGKNRKLLELLSPIDLRMGQALRICQGLEGSLKLLHTLIDDSEQRNTKKIRSINNLLSKGTLGQLINVLKQRIDIPQDAREYIFEAIEMRNEIVHWYWNRPGLAEKLDSAEGRQEICEDIEEKIREIRARDLFIVKIIDEYLVRYEISTQDIKDEAAQRWSFLRDEE